MSLIVSSNAMGLRTLTELSDKQIARVIQTVNGVGEVSLAGGRAREIHIVVDIEKLNSYGLSMTEVRDAVVAENVEIPGGTVEQGKGQLLLRTLGRVDATQDFNSLVVATKGGTPIRISDIGHAEDSFERPTSAVWMGETPAVMDPASVKTADWAADDGTLVVPRAGEMLFRVGQPPDLS